MEPLSRLDAVKLGRVRAVLTDIDDTLTDDGRLAAATYAALEALRGAGLIVVPVTGRPAGWCDLIARQWPVDAVVGENGALWFARDAGRLSGSYWRTPAERIRDRQRLDALAPDILRQVPGCALASDQPYRISDLAIDIAEDVPRLPETAVTAIAAHFTAAGATAKVSSIHVNGWFGAFDKLAMSRRLFADRFAIDLDTDTDAIVFVGDSPNDSPMFKHFPLSVGVANVRAFADRLPHAPAYVTGRPGGAGFVEIALRVLEARR